MNGATNLLFGENRTNKLSLLYIFVTIIGLGLAIVATGVVGLISRAQYKAIEKASQNALAAYAVTGAKSNEPANPGKIGFYLAGKLTGGINDDGTFDVAAAATPGGTLALTFLNPETTPFPTTVRFPAQTITVTTDSETLLVCAPSMTGNGILWVARNGSTYYDQTLTRLARKC